MRCLLLASLVACGPAASPQRAQIAADSAAYAVALEQCFQLSQNRAKYEECAKQADVKFGVKR